MANLPSLLPIVAKETAAVQTAGLCCKLFINESTRPASQGERGGRGTAHKALSQLFFIALLRTFSLAIMPASLHPERGCNRMCS